MAPVVCLFAPVQQRFEEGRGEVVPRNLPTIRVRFRPDRTGNIECEPQLVVEYLVELRGGIIAIKTMHDSHQNT